MDRFAYASLYETVSEIIASAFQDASQYDLFGWFSAREVSQVGHRHRSKQFCKHIFWVYISFDEESSLLQQESLLNSELQKRFFRNAPDNIPDGIKASNSE